jgi:hypothetical protein
MLRSLAALAAVLFATVLLATFAGCGTSPKTSLTDIPEGPPLSAVDDSLYAAILERSMSPTGAISYTQLRGDTELTDYLGQVARIRLGAFNSRWQLLALWLNAHNAYALDYIRSNMPVRSIDDISGFRYAKLAIVAGERYSLDEIEHSILTHQFREPRAFFALFDGSKSGPKLLETPYSGDHLSEELDAQVRTFLADSTRNMLDKKTNTLYLSKIFQDYAPELEQAAGTLRAFVRSFASSELGEWMDSHSQMKIAYLSYDYTLNTSDVEAPHERAPQKSPRRRSSGGIE